MGAVAGVFVLKCGRWRGQSAEFARYFPALENTPVLQLLRWICSGLPEYGPCDSLRVEGQRSVVLKSQPIGIVEWMHYAKVSRYAGSQNLPSIRSKDCDDRYRRHQSESVDCAIPAAGTTLFQ